MRKIARFLTVSPGWKYGTGVPPEIGVAARALKINHNAAWAGLETDAFLGVDGEIRVAVYHASTYLQFTVEQVDSIEYVREEGGEETSRVTGLTLEEALSILEMYELEIWRSSVSSTVTTTTTAETVSKISHSKLPGAVQVFRSWSGIAPFELALQSADT